MRHPGWDGEEARKKGSEERGKGGGERERRGREGIEKERWGRDGGRRGDIEREERKRERERERVREREGEMRESKGKRD